MSVIDRSRLDVCRPLNHPYRARFRLHTFPTVLHADLYKLRAKVKNHRRIVNPRQDDHERHRTEAEESNPHTNRTTR